MVLPSGAEKSSGARAGLARGWRGQAPGAGGGSVKRWRGFPCGQRGSRA